MARRRSAKLTFENPADGVSETCELEQAGTCLEFEHVQCLGQYGSISSYSWCNSLRRCRLFKMSICLADSDEKEDADWEPDSLRHWPITPRSTKRVRQRITERIPFQKENSSAHSPPRPKRRNLRENAPIPSPISASRSCNLLSAVAVGETCAGGSPVSMDFCPGCQMPLLGRTEEWCHHHIADCLDFPTKGNPGE